MNTPSKSVCSERHSSSEDEPGTAANGESIALGAITGAESKSDLLSKELKSSQPPFNADSAPTGLKAYQTLSRAAAPIAKLALQQRLKRGKEDPDRIGERRGLASQDRPDGELIWIHGASVGESLSVLPLIERISLRRPEINILVTTGTVTSAQLMKERLPEGVIHQFIPIDHPAFVAQFLHHWRPTAALFVESEFWPNLILAAREHVDFMAIINGRVSPKSFQSWSQRPHTIRFLLSAFDLIIAQDQQNQDRLTALSGQAAKTFGNLKNAAPPLPADAEEVQSTKASLNGRPVWLAASTHEGEEELIIDTHRRLVQEIPDLLTILAPRHPNRGHHAMDLLRAANLKGQQRSKKRGFDPSTDIYIADTLGELGLLYRLSTVAFVGGSLIKKGGHNPLEPARLGCAILHGPHIFNFVETYADMRKKGGAALVRNERDLATSVGRLLKDEKTRSTIADVSRSTAEASAERTLNLISDEIFRHLPKKAHAAQ
ncbi:MAG: 3-deoxy-D-manno-octulosonic acid transferase [Pseudomonadota bacterium]